MFPHAGGTYVFLREAYGRLWSFLWAWAEFWVIRTGAIAALAVFTAMSVESIAVEANYEASRTSETDRHQRDCVLAVINILGTRLGGGVLNVATRDQGRLRGAVGAAAVHRGAHRAL